MWGCNWSNLKKPEFHPRIPRLSVHRMEPRDAGGAFKKYRHIISPVHCVQRFQQICALPINASENTSPACHALDFHNNQPKRNWAKFFSCKTRYVAENSSNFQFLVYCWKCNGKSQPEISHGRLRARREGKLIKKLKQNILERTSMFDFSWFSWSRVSF